MLGDFSDVLYVIFHGAWAFVENAGEPFIHAYAPDIEEHVYMGGSWLGEIKILQGSTLQLSSNTSPSDSFETLHVTHDNDFVIFPERKATPKFAYAHIILPRPEKIISEMVVPGVGVRTVDGKSVTQNLGLVPVFQYDLNKVDPVMVSVPDGQIFWKSRGANQYAASKAITLHLFAADDTNFRVGVASDFTAVAALLGYVADLEFPLKTVPFPAKVQTEGLQPPRDYEITTFLHQRVAWLNDIGRQFEVTGPVSIPGQPPLTRFTMTAADSSSCGGGGGGS